MKFATILNIKESKRATVIIDNTIYGRKPELLSDSHFYISDSFYDFIKDIVGDKLGNKEDCVVSIVNTDDIDDFIDPINNLLHLMEHISKSQ